MPRAELPTPAVPIATFVSPTSIAPTAGPSLVTPSPATGGLIVARPAAAPAAVAGSRATPNGRTSVELAGSDFVLLEEPKRQTVGIVFARDGHGKTHLVSNYCPEPVVVVGLDGRGEREIKKALNRGRRVYYLDASMPANVMQMTHEQAQKHGEQCLELIYRNYEWAIEKSIKEWGKGTFVFDTSTELRDMARVAVRGRVDRPNPRSGEKGDFGKSDALINRALKYFADRSRQSNLNLILLSRGKPVYEGREDTGRITWDTDKIFSQAADWIVEYRMVHGFSGGFAGGGLLGMSASPLAPVANQGPSYEIHVTNPKCAPEEMGKVYRDSEWVAEGGPFSYLCTRLIPGSTPDDWR